MALSLALVLASIVSACTEFDGETAANHEPAASKDLADLLHHTESRGTGGELADARAGSGDGHLPLEVTLDLFASVYGAIDGGEPRFDQVRPHDASLTLRALARRWDELTEEQQAVVQNSLKAEGGPTGIRRSPLQDPDDDQVLQQRADAMVKDYERYLGGIFTIPIELHVVSEGTWSGRGTQGDAASMRNGQFVTRGEWDTCQVRIHEDETDNELLLAHEVFHCLQFQMAQTLAEFWRAQDWIVEGGAEWAAVTLLGRTDDVTLGFFTEWQQTTDTLYNLDYAAVGYFWTVEGPGGALESYLWDSTDGIPAMIRAGVGNDAHSRNYFGDDLTPLARDLVTASANAAADRLAVADLWSIPSGNVPEVSNRLTVNPINEGNPLDWAEQMPSFAKLPVLEVEIADDVDAVNIEGEASAAAVQPVGGMMKTFQGRFQMRLCFTEEADRRVLIGLTRAEEAGQVGINVSVPPDSDDTECPTGIRHWHQYTDENGNWVDHNDFAKGMGYRFVEGPEPHLYTASFVLLDPRSAGDCAIFGFEIDNEIDPEDVPTQLPPGTAVKSAWKGVQRDSCVGSDPPTIEVPTLFALLDNGLMLIGSPNHKGGNTLIEVPAVTVGDKEPGCLNLGLFSLAEC